MKKNILVNATSATVGGSLTILNQFIENIDNDLDKNKTYYIFVPVTSNLKSFDNIVIIPIKAKKYLDRIKWDLFGMKKWCKGSNIKPNLIVSLQNTGVLFGKIPQVIYLHQSLPFAKESSWSLLKKDERKMWFYKYLYKIWIDCTIQKNHYIVVQTKWMKDAVIKSGYSKDKIIVSRPEINNINVDKIECIDKDYKKFLFYPAADYKYKNHIILIKAIKIMTEKDISIKGKFKILFTLDRKSIIYKQVVEFGIEDYFEFLGPLKYEEVLSYYKGCHAVLFPSYIETFGLPLIEASIFGKRILVSDCEYSSEILSKYSLVSFIPHNSVSRWEEEIRKSIIHYEEKPNYFQGKNGWDSVFELINKVAEL